MLYKVLVVTLEIEFIPFESMVETIVLFKVVISEEDIKLIVVVYGVTTLKLKSLTSLVSQLLIFTMAT